MHSQRRQRTHTRTHARTHRLDGTVRGLAAFSPAKKNFEIARVQKVYR